MIYMSSYALNEDGTDFIDENGKKIEYTVEDILFNHDLKLFLNKDGHAETDRNIIAKPAVNDDHVVVKSQVSVIVRDAFLDLWVSEYLRMYSSCTYQMDRADGQTVEMDLSRKVETIYDKSNEESDATQTDASKRPRVCTKAEKHNGRYFLKFSGSQKMVSQVNLNNDCVNVFIVYKMTSRISPNIFWNNGLFGHDNTGYDKFVAHRQLNLVISGAASPHNCVYIGNSASLDTFMQLDDYTENDLGELNKWHCLSVHWDNKSSPKTEKSKIYWNRKHMGDFTADNRTGNNKTVFGGLDPTTDVAPLNGNIAFFCVYLDFMLDERTILDHHTVLMQRYNIT